MAFADLAEAFDDALHLPIDGTVYDIPSPDYELGLWVQAMVSAGISISQGLEGDPDRKIPKLRFEGEDGDEDSEEARLYARLLGPAWRRLRDDKVSWPKIKMVAETTVYWIAMGVDVAEQYWNSGGDPKAVSLVQRGNRATRRATASKSTGTASTTRRPASTKATTSRATRSAR